MVSSRGVTVVPPQPNASVFSLLSTGSFCTKQEVAVIFSAVALTSFVWSRDRCYSRYHHAVRFDSFKNGLKTAILCPLSPFDRCTRHRNPLRGRGAALQELSENLTLTQLHLFPHKGSKRHLHHPSEGLRELKGVCFITCQGHVHAK